MTAIDDCAVNEPVRRSSRRKKPEAQNERRLISRANVNKGFRHLLAAWLALHLGMVSVEAATLVATYDFQNTLAPQPSSIVGANALTAVDPLWGSGFVQDEVDGAPRTVWRFAGNAAPAGDQGGLLFTSGALLTAEAYSVEL